MTIGVIGGGAFGTALAAVFAREGHAVLQFMRNETLAKSINAHHINTDRLPEVVLPENLRATAQIDELSNANVILMVLPAQQTHSWLEAHHSLLPDVPIVACAKGIDRNTGLFQTQILAKFFGENKIAALSGPGFAKEIATGMPTALTIGSRDDALAKDLQKQLSTKAMRLYETTDVLGVELGGAMKNIIAIGCGVSIGANLGQSARAALLTRGFAEMVKLGLALGARAETLGGLAGLGDLTLTATSELSRNYQMGLSLGAGKGGDIGKTTEGAYTAKMAIQLAQKHGLELPVTQTICKLVEGELDISSAVQQLLSRPLGREF